MMKKKVIAFVLVVVLLLSLAACGSKLPKELEQYAIPWKVDAVKQAKETGSMHYYFMSAQGMTTAPTGTYPEKWGDSCLIIFPDGQTMLIDTGLGTYAQVLVENLRRLGIKQLDYVVISHPHNDHSNALWEEGGILDNFKVGRIYSNGVYNGDWKNVTVLEDLCKEKNIPYQVLKQGDELTFGEVQASVLWPRADIVGKTFTSEGDYDPVEDINNTSIVIRFDYKEHSSMFGGDVFSTGEAELVEDYADQKDILRVDLLKAMHHGSHTSNSATLLYTARPELVVSTGFAPVVGEVKDIFADVGATLLSDRDFGYVHVSSEGGGMTYEFSGVNQ